MTKMISIEVAYATPNQQRILEVQVKEQTTIEEAIKQSGIMKIFPEIDLGTQKVGIFSQPKALTNVVQQHDRVEIYRPLLIDPKDARRRRVKKK